MELIHDTSLGRSDVDERKKEREREETERPKAGGWVVKDASGPCVIGDSDDTTVCFVSVV